MEVVEDLTMSSIRVDISSAFLGSFESGGKFV